MYGEWKIEDCQGREVLFLDVRSPKEYEDAHIPGAVNLPLLDDEERVVVGTLYVQGDIEEAKRQGVLFVSQKFPAMMEEIFRLTRETRDLVIYCARGGYRSRSLFHLLRHGMDVPVSRLEGGYKAYRKYVREGLEERIAKHRFIVLDGMTGCGKTEILEELQDLGAQVLDLEGLANHRGSLLGGVGLGDQPSQKQFESALFDALEGEEGPIFTEGESMRIGSLLLPKSLHEKMRKSIRLRIDAPMDCRVARIREEYVKEGNDEEILRALHSLGRYVNPKRLLAMEEKFCNQEVDSLIEELMTSYYDPKYRLGTEVEKTYTNRDPKACAEEIWRDYGPHL